MTKEDEYFIAIMLEIKKQAHAKGAVIIGFICAENDGPAYVPFPSASIAQTQTNKILCESAILAISEGIKCDAIESSQQFVNVKNPFARHKN